MSRRGLMSWRSADLAGMPAWRRNGEFDPTEGELRVVALGSLKLKLAGRRVAG
jgi:uncharacterized Zn-binding protein involved in type VI secretion